MRAPAMTRRKRRYARVCAAAGDEHAKVTKLGRRVRALQDELSHAWGERAAAEHEAALLRRQVLELRERVAELGEGS